MKTKPEKPLGHRAYGSIPHLPGSRNGNDEVTNKGWARILTEKARDRHDHIIVTEKLDGSCVSIANIDGEIVPLIRAGYRAADSIYEMHHHFAHWVEANRSRFAATLSPGERLAGEWLAEAHGTRYNLPHGPFVAFDLFRHNPDEPRKFMHGHSRAPHEMLFIVCSMSDIPMPRVIHCGGPISIPDVLAKLEPSGHGALDPVEGAVWRVERRGQFDFIAKYVRHDKVDGKYLTKISGEPPVYNWTP